MRHEIFSKPGIILIIWVFLFLSTNSIFSQTVYEPITSDVYPYLGKMAQKGLIEFNDLIKPLSREYIYQKLDELTITKGKISAVDKEELKFWLKDYGFEQTIDLSKTDEKLKLQSRIGSETSQSEKANNLSWVKDKWGRFRLFSYNSELFKVNLDPIFGYEVASRDGERRTHFWNGAYFYGYIGKHIGFSFSFRDNDESGKTVDRTKSFTPETGVIKSLSSINGFQYGKLQTTIAVSWNWGSFSIGKDFLEWGYANSGKIVLSDKAPSYPYLRLDIHPAKWLYFNYVHAWLSSDVIDSSQVYPTLRDGENRILYRNKFLASHTLTVVPTNGISVSLGESVIYSDRLELSYLFPLMFFRAADHYLSGNNNNAGANSQFFLNVSSRNNIKNTHLYGTIFIDELALSDIFEASRSRNQIAFTLGGSVTDLPVDNITFKLEYSKLYPFVYRHYIPAQTYENHGYVLGHWLQHNSDIIYSSLNYRFLRGLQATVWAEYIRKGGDGVVDDQYMRPSKPFLFGERKNYTNWGFEAKYQITHELYARFKFQSYRSSIQQNDNSFVDKKESLVELIDLIQEVSNKKKVIFPIHPRTKKNLENYNLLKFLNHNIIVTGPLSYIDFIALLKNSNFVLTDSGGIQEESTYLHIPCVTLRTTTERPITVDIGTNYLVGENINFARQYIAEILDGKSKKGKIPDLWDGKAAERIVNILTKGSSN